MNPANLRSKRARARAFTLLEVLVALAILAMAAVVLGAAYMNVLNSYHRIAQGQEAEEEINFARRQFLAEPDVKKIEEGGEFDGAANRHVRWTATAAATSIADLFTATFNCEITDPLKNEPLKFTETVMLFRPTWSDPTERTKLQQEAKDRITEMQQRRP